MTMRSWAYSHFLLPRMEPMRFGGMASRMRSYEALSRCSPAELKARSQAKLNELFVHAYDTVPLYRERFTAAGYHRGDHVDAAGLQQVPVLTRRDMLDYRDELWSRAYQKEDLLVTSSGGTTSAPVTFYRDREGQLEKGALQWHLNGLCGYLPGDASFNLWGAQFDYAANPSWRWKLYERYLQRAIYAQTSSMGEKIFAEHLARYNEMKPDVLYGYPNPVAEFCEYLQRTNARFHRPKLVICTAETLAPAKRELIQSVLGCKVFNHYGSRELGMTCAECEEQRMHLVPTATHFELLPLEDGDDGVCELIATDLINRGMPLIRYKMNDCVIPDKGKCSCGIGYPLLGEVVGRSGDMLQMPDGTLTSTTSMANVIMRVLTNSPTITDVQFIQNELGALTLRYVVSSKFEPEHLSRLETKLREYCHPGLRWDFERVSEIPRERSGKKRITICNLPRETFQAEAAR